MFEKRKKSFKIRRPFYIIWHQYTYQHIDHFYTMHLKRVRQDYPRELEIFENLMDYKLPTRVTNVKNSLDVYMP